MAGAFSSERGLLPSHPLNNPTNRESASFSVFELKYDLIRSRISFKSGLQRVGVSLTLSMAMTNGGHLCPNESLTLRVRSH
jgi:hypothetical protein